MEVDKTDVGDEDHAREEAAFWMASRGCIRVQGWGVQGWCVRRAGCAERACQSSAFFFWVVGSRHWLWGLAGPGAMCRSVPRDQKDRQP